MEAGSGSACSVRLEEGLDELLVECGIDNSQVQEVLTFSKFFYVWVKREVALDITLSTSAVSYLSTSWSDLETCSLLEPEVSLGVIDELQLPIDSLCHLSSFQVSRLSQEFEPLSILLEVLSIFSLDVSLQSQETLRLVKLSRQVPVLMLLPDDLPLESFDIIFSLRVITLIIPFQEVVILPNRLLLWPCGYIT